MYSFLFQLRDVSVNSLRGKHSFVMKPTDHFRCHKQNLSVIEAINCGQVEKAVETTNNNNGKHFRVVLVNQHWTKVGERSLQEATGGCHMIWSLNDAGSWHKSPNHCM